ncbi:chymotrypsin-2-like, partial [Bombus bifarius]|uniref:Chymotrypsin-2-like n=1 Tax=Bombus bifarius TaxID=103933 RepID=A0A6P8MCH8_9HYME
VHCDREGAVNPGKLFWIGQLDNSGGSVFIIYRAVNRNVFCISRSAFEINQWDTNLIPDSSYEEEGVDELDSTRIVGGQFAVPNQFPFMAVVHRLLGNGMTSQCGGTIISSRWVLTAGHCVVSGPKQFLVVFGICNKTGIEYNSYNGPGVAMLTNKAILHPNYQTTLNDIALLYMPRNIPFRASIQPIKLAGYNYVKKSFTGRTGAVIGWGKDGSSGAGTKRLKYAFLPIISNKECSTYWAVTEKHVCTSASYHQDACQGDSGGPLIVFKNNVPLQIGIVSYGDGYCPSNKPGVFTRVVTFIDWIQQVTKLRF